MGAKEIPRSQELERLTASRGTVALSFEPVQNRATKRGPLHKTRALALASVKRQAGKIDLSAKGTEQRTSISLALLEERENLTRDYFMSAVSWS